MASLWIDIERDSGPALVQNLGNLQMLVSEGFAAAHSQVDS